MHDDDFDELRQLPILRELGGALRTVAALEDARESPPPAAAARRRTMRRPFWDGSRSRTFAVVLVITASLAGTAYAVPTTRIAAGNIADSLSAWVSGDGDSAPGRPVAPGDDAPAWFSQQAGDRLLAEADGVGLFAKKFESDRGTLISFALGAGLSRTATLESWRQQLDRQAVIVLGDSIFGGARGVLDDRGRIPLFGVTSRDVVRVELQYAEGPRLVSDNGDGGFVMLVDAWRPMRELVAYDATGHVLGRADVSKYDRRYQCEKEPGCPPDVSSSSHP